MFLDTVRCKTVTYSTIVYTGQDFDFLLQDPRIIVFDTFLRGFEGLLKAF